MDSREKIFQRFFRLGASDSSGSGLGLFIVKELVFQCGGSIRLQSPPQGGSGLLVVVEFVGE